MEKKRSGWVRIITILLVLALVGGGAYYIYQQNSGDGEPTVYVQSVSAITGMGNVGLYAQYNGIVEAKDVIEINPSAGMTVKECFVTAGSKVNEGDRLFRYDVEDMELQLAQMQIDVSGMENSIRTYRDQLESLKKKLSKAKEDERYEIELDIQTVELAIRKAEYDLADKRKKADEMQSLIDTSEVFSPVTGTVRSVRDNAGGYDPFGYGYSDGSSAYITIIAGTAFCVKGVVNEQTVFTLYAGMPVLIRSRVNDTVLRGTIYRVNTDSPETDSGPVYYDGGGERASRYAFYVEPESIDGLLIGQHVLIDLNANAETNSGLMLPASFLFSEGDYFFVWAVDADGRIEKRNITVDAYDEETECFRVTGGLALRDRIAFPDATVHAGMLASESAFSDPSGNGAFGGGANAGNGGWSAPADSGRDVPADDFSGVPNDGADFSEDGSDEQPDVDLGGFGG